MKNNSPQNFNCEFAPETIDFIYGEMSGERKNAFQVHLKNCEDCADEIRGFSDIKFSIQDWKTSEFDKIPTPEFEIPYQKINQIVIANEKISFFDSVKNYFRFSPVLSGAAAFAVLALLIGSGVFLLQNERESTIAENIPASDLSPTPSVVRGSVNSENENSKPKSVETNKPENENPSPVLADGKDKNTGKTVPSKAINKTVGDEKNQTVKTTEKKSAPIGNINNGKDQKAVQTTKKPRLNDLPDDEEDNSLRLSDMFAELDTK